MIAAAPFEDKGGPLSGECGVGGKRAKWEVREARAERKGGKVDSTVGTARQLVNPSSQPPSISCHFHFNFTLSSDD